MSRGSVAEERTYSLQVPKVSRYGRRSRGFLKWFLLLASLLPLSALAIPVTIVHLDSELAMPEDKTQELLEELVAVYKIAHMPIEPTLIHANFKRWVYFFGATDYLPALVKEFPELVKHREPVHFISEALWDPYHYLQYYIGFSFPNLRVSISSAQEQNSKGINYHEISVAAAIHEIGHDFGARHVHDCSIMDTNILHCIHDGGTLFWNETSVHELRRFRTSWRRNGHNR